MAAYEEANHVVSIRSRLLGREILIEFVFDGGLIDVSIRSRLLGREIPTSTSTAVWVGSFNPLPAVGPGDTTDGHPRRLCHFSFNPLPAVGPGDTIRHRRKVANFICFNPLPAVGPGDTAASKISARLTPVSIRSRLLGREIPQARAFSSLRKLVSIRSRLLGREILITAFSGVCG